MSVIRATTLVGIIPMLGDRDQEHVEEVALLVRWPRAGEQQVEVLREAQAAHQVVAEVEPAHLDAVGEGLADAADRRAGLTDPPCDLRP